MLAVMRHELNNFFTTLTAYVFGAFLLCFIGIGAMMYNLNAAVSNFEYVLSFASIVFIIIIPILTMRVIAEERKQKTDKLLYSLPISTTQIVLGKFFALLVVFLIPTLIVSVYPLVFSKYGEVYLLTSYGSIVSFFIMGSSLIALGIFISGLTENQGFAAGICVTVILFNYFSVSLAEYVSATAFGSLAVICVFFAILAFVIKYLTKSDTLGIIIGVITVGGNLLLFRFKNELYEGLVPKIMTGLSLFKRFEVFVDGIFDLTGIVYFISVIVLFLFLSVQSLEKRRYN